MSPATLKGGRKAARFSGARSQRTSFRSPAASSSVNSFVATVLSLRSVTSMRPRSRAGAFVKLRPSSASSIGTPNSRTSEPIQPIAACAFGGAVAGTSRRSSSSIVPDSCGSFWAA